MAIEIYTQPWCPYCARAMSLLSAKGVAFREIDAPHGSAERREAIRRSGGRTTMPQIFIGERRVVVVKQHCCNRALALPCHECQNSPSEPMGSGFGKAGV